MSSPVAGVKFTFRDRVEGRGSDPGHHTDSRVLKSLPSRLDVTIRERELKSLNRPSFSPCLEYRRLVQNAFFLNPDRFIGRNCIPSLFAHCRCTVLTTWWAWELCTTRGNAKKLAPSPPSAPRVPSISLPPPPLPLLQRSFSLLSSSPAPSLPLLFFRFTGARASHFDMSRENLSPSFCSRHRKGASASSTQYLCSA